MNIRNRVCSFKSKHEALGSEDKRALQAKQGRVIFGVDMKIVGEDGGELPWDGKAFGNLLVRGPWICREYFKGEGGNPLQDGWFRTGDLFHRDEAGDFFHLGRVDDKLARLGQPVK